ncbi:MAG: hypothetical protein KF864_09475 [Phycisphaeraceae bacterium]|nr:hypothetical protein [Phycisphaeraceae bacterium]
MSAATLNATFLTRETAIFPWFDPSVIAGLPKGIAVLLPAMAARANGPSPRGT